LVTRAETAVIIVAAGRGSRAGDGLPKQWRDLGGMPVVARSAAAFQGFARVVVVLHPDDLSLCIDTFGGRVVLVAGGADRSESVRNALATLEGSGIGHVLIHDGARPLVSNRVIDAVLAALDGAAGAAPALPVTDALWHGADGRVAAAAPRDGLFRAQTPQGFALPAILAAFRAHPLPAADDVAVALAAGLDVAITEGEEENIKITWPADFERAGRVLRSGEGAGRMDIRTGNGYDVHAFRDGDHVMLCGVRVAHDKGLLGHSDADVGMHALTDAIYGALAEGDIVTQ
jgi:2-C-methyl-D-erythritol 4-phosphate cytidylyltransferase/2-C-methyl-D-erythritol 2,4-cyclodiphosphate synthase